MKTASVIINADGTMTLETSGYRGKACEAKIKEVLDGMQKLGAGVQVTDKEKKSEYFMPEEVGVQYGSKN